MSCPIQLNNRRENFEVGAKISPVSKVPIIKSPLRVRVYIVVAVPLAMLLVLLALPLLLIIYILTRPILTTKSSFAQISTVSFRVMASNTLQ
mmetsp:Transcript_104864/g.172385  ORF Transcript_104864/g.172385 Transcript_104864/m.172385 type:complete len:92 (+) Transcript_104864:178-453(+)